MAAGEVLLNGTQLDDGTANSHATAANVFDANAMTYWLTNPAATTGWVGMDAGAACSLTRVRMSPLGGYEDAMVGGIVQGGSSSTFPQALGYQQGYGGFTNATNQATIAKAFTNAQTAGNCNIVFVSMSASAVISGVADTKGNTYVLAYGPSGGTHISCYISTGIVAATAGSNTVTVTFSTHSDFPTIMIAEYSGISGTGTAALDGNNSASGTGTALNSGSITTTSANDVIICFGGGGGAPTISSGSGFVMNVNLSPGWDAAMEEVPVTATGTYSGTFTLSSSQSWVCTVVALKLTGVYDPNLFLFVANRPVSGTLLNEYLITGAPNFRYFRYAAPSGSNGNLGDVDFIVQYASGVVGSAVSPTILPAGRCFDLPVVVRLSSITTDASIYYTTDGTTPTISSTLYSGPFAINSSCTFKAIAVSAGLSNSRVTSTYFNIPSLIVSTNNFYDDRNYRLWAISSYIFYDPIGKYWYMYGWNQDQPGVKTFGLIGINIYKSADLRNWIYSGIILQPGAGLEINSALAYGRPCVGYNASTTNYVMWVESSVNVMQVYTASSPVGPWTFVSGYSVLNSNAITTDCIAFFDDNGTDAYLNCTSGANSLFTKLNSAWTNVDGTNFNTYNSASTFGIGPPDVQLHQDGPHIFQNGSTYFFLCNAQNGWAPTLNCYATSSSPIGPWTNKGNPFIQQAGGGNGSPDYTLAYGSQNNNILRIPGRNAWIYTGDTYNTGLAGSVNTSSTANFQTSTIFFLPIAFPTSTTMSINWNNSWTFDGVFPTSRGAPLAPTGFSVSGGAASWINHEPNPHNLYLDAANDPGFTSGVASEALPAGATSFTIALPRKFYRVRAVNANGSSASGDGPIVLTGDGSGVKAFF